MKKDKISGILIGFVSFIIRMGTAITIGLMPIIIIAVVILGAVYMILPMRGIFNGNHNIVSPDQLNSEWQKQYIQLENTDKENVIAPFHESFKIYEEKESEVNDDFYDDVHRKTTSRVASRVASLYSSLYSSATTEIRNELNKEKEFIEKYYLPQSVMGAVDVMVNSQKSIETSDTVAPNTFDRLKTNINTEKNEIEIQVRVEVYREGKLANSFVETRTIPITSYTMIDQCMEKINIKPKMKTIFNDSKRGRYTHKKRIGKDSEGHPIYKRIHYSYNVKTTVDYPVLDNVIIDRPDIKKNKIMEYLYDKFQYKEEDYTLFYLTKNAIEGDLTSGFYNNDAYKTQGINVKYIVPDMDLSHGFIFPIYKGRISSDYGYRTHPKTHKRMSWHGGLDISAPQLTPVYAITDGTVTNRQHYAAGNYVVLNHKDGQGYSRYLHLHAFATKGGTKVKKGDVIGYVGTTGRSTGNHLHFELYVNGSQTQQGETEKNRVHPLFYMKLPSSVGVKSTVELDYILAKN